VSGRKQHFIPQSLLKGFGFERGKKTYVVAYTYDRGIFSPPTDGIGAERSFYSELNVEGATETLDDKITDYEQRLSAILESLRVVTPHADSLVVAELVTHLTVRNDNFRKAASSGGSELVAGMTDVLADEDSARVLMGISGDEPTELFASQLPQLWEQFGPTFRMAGFTQEQFNKLAFEGMKANFSGFHAEMVRPMKDAFAGMATSMPEIAANSQRRSLSENLAPPLRIEKLARYEWRTIQTSSLIALPDCVAVGIQTDGKALPLMLADIDQTETVLMPLASERMLVGSPVGEAEVPDDLIDVFSGCSWDFFIARERTPELESARNRLRTSINAFLSGTIDEVIEETMDKNRPA